MNKEDVKDISDVVCRNFLGKTEEGSAVMFNPMGMGIFDIAIGQYYYDQARDKKTGKEIE